MFGVVRRDVNSDCDIEHLVQQVAPQPADLRLNALSTLTDNATAATHPDIVKVVTEGAGLICVCGRIEYEDDDGGAHWLDYCLTYDGNAFEPYCRFNSADTNDYGQGIEGASIHSTPTSVNSAEAC